MELFILLTRCRVTLRVESDTVVSAVSLSRNQVVTELPQARFDEETFAHVVARGGLDEMTLHCNLRGTQKTSMVTRIENTRWGPLWMLADWRALCDALCQAVDRAVDWHGMYNTLVGNRQSD